MKKSIITLAALAVMALAAPHAAAQVPSPEARVSLRVEGRALSEIVQYLREVSGANIVVKEGGDTLISLDLTDVPWLDALELAAELAGCVADVQTAGVIVLEKPPRVDFVFNDAEITDVIDAIAAISGANVVVAPEVAGTLSLRLQDVPWREALDVAVKTLGFTVVEEKRGILRVVDPLTLQAQMEPRSYQLRYLRPRGDFVPVIESEFVDGDIKAPKGKLEEDFPIVQALSKALSPGGELDYVASSNVVIVRDTTQVHAAVKDMLERLDVEPSQVFCDVKFVSTTSNDLLALGVDYGDAGVQVSASGGQIPITLPFDMGPGGLDDSIIVNPSGAGPFADPLLNAGNTVIPDTVYGALSFTGVAGTLSMLQRDSNTEVVQAPKIFTMDGRPATIFVGETIRYAEAKSEVGQTGSLQLSVTEAKGSPVGVGFQLMIVPHVVPGSNDITMDVIPKETSLSGTSSSTLAPAGFDFFTVGSGGDTGSIALPRVRTSTIVTSMLISSGQTAVVGGLTTDVDIETKSKIPLLGDIPFLGWLFKSDRNDKERRSLLVFLTPTIVRTSDDTEAVLQRELDRRREIYQAEYDRLLSDLDRSKETDDETDDGQ